MNAKVKLGYIIEEVTGKPSYTEELKECNSLLKTCNDKIDELANKEKEEKEEKENKIDFNDDLKKQIAVAGEAYVEFYFEYGEGTAPSAFAEQAYEDTENDTPLGEYKEQGKTIFMNAFKEAYEATGNEYY